MKNIIFTFTLLFSALFAFAQTSTDGPRVVFGDLKHDGPYDRSEILLQENINVSSSDGHSYQIISYKIIIAPKKGVATLASGSSNKLTPKIQSSLNQIIAEDKILIEAIRATRDNNADDVVDLKPIILVVKEFEKDEPYDLINGSNGNIQVDTALKATFGSIPADGFPKTLEEILKQTEIGVKSPKGLDYEVTGFKLITARKSAPASMATSNSNQLTETMTAMLSKLEAGDRILVEGIRSQVDVDGKTKRANLSPIIITVL